MAKRFAIATGSASTADRDLITTFLKGKGWQLWHWLPDFWFISDAPDTYTPQTLYAEITANTKITQQTHFLILHFPDGLFEFGGMANPEGWPWLGDIGGKPS